jgi:hypothetical protein
MSQIFTKITFGRERYVQIYWTGFHPHREKDIESTDIIFFHPPPPPKKRMILTAPIFTKLATTHFLLWTFNLPSFSDVRFEIAKYFKSACTTLGKVCLALNRFSQNSNG